MSINIILKSCCELCPDCKLNFDKNDLFADCKIQSREITFGCENSNICKKYIECEEETKKIYLSPGNKPTDWTLAQENGELVIDGIIKKFPYPIKTMCVKKDKVNDVMRNINHCMEVNGYLTVSYYYDLFKRYDENPSELFDMPLSMDFKPENPICKKWGWKSGFIRTKPGLLSFGETYSLWIDQKPIELNI